MSDIQKRLYGASPYEGLDISAHPEDMQGWSSTDPVFEQVISNIKPNLIVEVGTWKGASAIHMAKLIKKLGLKTEIICIDTWLGSPEHFIVTPQFQDRRDSLRLKNGYPQLYYTFASNVVREGCSDIITPLATTSINGAEILKKCGYVPDMVYIDAAHEYEPALADYRAYWPLLSASGVMIGDDFLSHEGVTRAAYEFSREVKRQIVGKHSKFVMCKNVAVEPKIVLG